MPVMKETTGRVLIAGAGPVGLVAAAHLVRQGIPVTVLEAEPALQTELRASTFHPPTLDMLDELGVAAGLIAQGLTAPYLQFRTRAEGKIAQFDFGRLAGVTRHPFRVQSEQFKLVRLLYDSLRNAANFEILFDAAVDSVEETASGVVATVRRNGGLERHAGAWIIGADGARSAVRRSAGIAFEGFTWPERFLVVSTPFDFTAVMPDLASVSYVPDPERWHFYLRVPGLWRVMFPIEPEIDDATATNWDFAQSRLAGLLPSHGAYEIAHQTLYRVHQRVAATFRKGRVLLAGDAAHINNPLGGMGMNGGIHDAVNLAEKLGRVWRAEASADELDRYDRERRGITLEVVQTVTIQNKKDLEAADPIEHAAFKQRLRETAADPKRHDQHLLRISMIASLGRAKELGSA
jgi:3-(3-hydroxy-phenyl)propionate hydroxylase